MCQQDCCCKGCCHGSTCNKVLRAFSLALCILAFCIHCAALGHTEWMCPTTGCNLWSTRLSLFHKFPGGTPIADYDSLFAFAPACWALAGLALGSSFMAFIFLCVRMCKVKKGCEVCALFFLFGAFGCEFLTWVIFLAKAMDLTDPVLQAARGRETLAFGQGFNCSVASMVISFIIFVMTAVSVKMSACQPIVSKENTDTVVVVQAQPGQVVVAGNQQVVGYAEPAQPTYVQQPGYVQQQQAPPAYGEPEKQPVY